MSDSDKNILSIKLTEPIPIPGLDRPRSIVFRNRAYKILTKKYGVVSNALHAYDEMYEKIKTSQVDEEVSDTFLFFLYAGLAQNDKEICDSDKTAAPLTIEKLDDMLTYGNQIGIGAYLRVALFDSLPPTIIKTEPSPEGVAVEEGDSKN